MEVTISYCAECGFGPLAVRIAESLIERYDSEGLHTISIVVGSEGVFEVAADGELVAHRDEGGLPDIEQVTSAIGARLT